MGGPRHVHPRYGRRLPISHQQGLRLASASWAIAAFTIALATLLHATNSPRAIPFFISETDHQGPADLVFTVGLTAAGLVQMAYAWHLYHKLQVEREHLWKVATLVALFASCNTVLVAHFDMYDFINPHIFTSMAAFGGGLLWAFLAHLAMGSNSTANGGRLRRLGAGAALVGFATMVVSFQLAVNTFDATGLSTEAFLNQAQAGINIAAPAEYLLVGGLFACLASFRHELMAQEQKPTEAS
jgi:hypothetical protein